MVFLYGTIIYMYEKQIRKKVVALRKAGKTYGEIRSVLNLKIPKSTLSDWCRDILLSQLQQQNIEIAQLHHAKRGREIAWLVNKIRREEYLRSIDQRIKHLSKTLKDKNVAKVAAAMLYLGEGAKMKRGSLMFGNSDPRIIRLFLHLLRFAYSIDENKFRCTVQCRADQNVNNLERFWSKETGIPRRQFYTSRIDPRTIGKSSKKADYKGVCRVDYFSADLFLELMKIGELLCMGL